MASTLTLRVKSIYCTLLDSRNVYLCMLPILNAAFAAWSTRHVGCSIFVARAVNLWFVTIFRRAQKTLTRESLASRRSDLWRYREVLPVDNDENIVSFGEGWTPLLRASRLGESLGLPELFIKDESQNPTQSFKARGMAAAVSMAKELGVKKLAVPSAGNSRPGCLRGPRWAGSVHLHATRYAAG